MTMSLSRVFVAALAGVLLLAALPVSAQSAAAATPLPATKVLEVRGVRIGEGAPKTIVPITATTAEEALAQAARIAANADTDIAEWRIDYLDNALDGKALARLGPQVAKALHGKPLLLTFRTKAEGGARPIADADYGTLYATLLQARFADLLDVEMFRDAAVVQALVAQAHAAGVSVVMSSHDFQRTPDTAEIVARLQRQQALGADVLKIAVMPRDAGDVLKLLDATWQLRRSSDRPLLTMAMGGTGVVSRLSGETFGQALTFGMLGKASAPGQVEVGRLREVLDTIHQAASAAR
ncbi:type I 3-dehydroquinate dehydratase [Xanthomonas bonasiae]|uniref:type I 3-dehydroquinate dehydratase n=1 Tax=Xanthomonas bonasiae TaxID=2810351 RepID=UPI001F130952|nr:type I 3-dehydroquinate dehydratase [Xanthomonas bonasiae]